MNVSEYADQLHLSENAKNALKECRLSDEKTTQFIRYLLSDDVQLHTLFDGCTPIECLLLCLWIANETKRQYKKRGLPERYFWENLKDITLWCEDYEKRTGRPGLSEYEWIIRTLTLRLFRIGRLQYEPKELQEEIHIDGKVYQKDLPILMIHIPAGEPLDYVKAKDSLHEAEFFFSNYFHFDYPIFYCRTWLLAPELIELLPSNSHILQFQSLFQIVRSYKDPFRQAEERVFGSILDDVSMYPEKTTLQRNLKQCLLQGGCSYKGVGIWQVQEKQKGQEE